jgi:hypothetical protein
LISIPIHPFINFDSCHCAISLIVLASHPSKILILRSLSILAAAARRSYSAIRRSNSWLEV